MMRLIFKYHLHIFAGPVSSFLPASARSNPKTNVTQKENLELRAGGNPSRTATRKMGLRG